MVDVYLPQARVGVPKLDTREWSAQPYTRETDYIQSTIERFGLSSNKKFGHEITKGTISLNIVIKTKIHFIIKFSYDSLKTDIRCTISRRNTKIRINMKPWLYKKHYVISCHFISPTFNIDVCGFLTALLLL